MKKLLKVYALLLLAFLVLALFPKEVKAEPLYKQFWTSLKEQSKFEPLNNGGFSTAWDAKNDRVLAGGTSIFYRYKAFAMQAVGLEPTDGKGNTIPGVSPSLFVGHLINKYASVPDDWILLNRLHIGPYGCLDVDSGQTFWGAQAGLVWYFGGAKRNDE